MTDATFASERAKPQPKDQLDFEYLSGDRRVSRINGNTVAFCILILCTVLAIRIGAPTHAEAQTTRQTNPTVSETLRWMQTSLESGSGDIWVGHEVRSVRLEDFVGCKAHFSFSTHQEPYMNGEPAPEPNKTSHIDYFFELGDIDPANITFSKGPDSRPDVPSFITVRTRNDEKKIASGYSWEPDVRAKPDDTYVIFAVEAYGSDNDYVVRFAKAFKHAVEACGGKPSFFVGSDGQDEDQQASPAAGGIASQSAPPRKDIPAIAKAANGVIVTIITSDKDGKPIAQGTGFLVREDGRIVTNYHVIRNASSAIVKLPDGAFYDVEGMLAFDRSRDLAVIKARGQNFRTVVLGNSDRLQVGEAVVAIGNPLSLESTVSSGIVSGIRDIEDEGGKYLQITAPISPGSSGGPLFNMAGEVVGITTLYLKGGENLNFAIPINDAKPLLLPSFSKVYDLPNEAEPQTSEGDSPSSVVAQTPIRAATGEYGGIVHNKTANLSAEFSIIVNDVGGVITGCMGVRQPLFGSGPLTGRVDGANISFVVTSAIGKITFVGQRNNSDITGTYTVERQGSPDQQGNFTLNKVKSDGWPSNFDTANCPTDAEVHK